MTFIDILSRDDHKLQCVLLGFQDTRSNHVFAAFSWTHLETEVVYLDFDLAIPAIPVRFDINPFVGALAVCLGLWCCWKVKSKVFCCFYQLFFLDYFLSIILLTFLPLLMTSNVTTWGWHHLGSSWGRCVQAGVQSWFSTLGDFLHMFAVSPTRFVISLTE